MASLGMTGKTRKGALGAGATARGLGGGPSQRTGKGRAGKTGYTRGGTTSQNNNAEDENFIEKDGVKVDIRPKPLVRDAAEKPAEAGVPGQETEKAGEEGKKDKDKDKPAEEKKEGDAKGKKDPVAESAQSGMTSSLMETSEDEEAKRKQDEAAKKKAKKGLTDEEKNAEVAFTLCETETTTLLLIPGVYVGGDKEEEFAQTEKANKAYQALQEKKISSDTYIERGSQTLNLTQKNREITFQGYQQATKELQATNWEIISASQQKRVSEAEKQRQDYNRFVDNIMTECLKNPGALIDAEALASHVSVANSAAAAAVAQQKSGTNSSKSGAKDSKKMKSSQSNLNASEVGKSQTSDKLSGTSMSQTGTGTQAISGDTVGGDFANMAKRVEYVETELPDTMMKAIRIIERLLTQTEYHEQHVLYKNYPPAKVQRRTEEDEEDEEGAKKKGLMNKKKEEEKKRLEEEAAAAARKEQEGNLDEKDDRVTFKPLFHFECDVTEGRQVSCMDINELNPDLIAVGYGEYDINCVDDSKLKPGLLCFWTLKNPNFPEKIIKHENSITACQFSKKNPNLIAIGDSHGNIAIYNIRGDDTKPIAESKDMEAKHTDIVWEIQWMQRENKSESLISISGDGRIIEWSMKKGLEYNELMQLKRETNPNQKDVYAGAEIDKKAGGMTFINTGGLSIDFPNSVESNVQYFVATEDCAIHCCSMSYSEQYLDTYYGHTGPIYRVRCSPFWHKDDCPIFLTCSYDWTVRVWHAKEKEKHICHQIESLKEQVNDISWSPNTSSVFASVANDGRIEIWDLKRDNLQPLLTHFDQNSEGQNIATPKTIVRFAKNSPVVLAGDLVGKVGVYRTVGLEHVQVSEKDQIMRLISSITKDEFGDAGAKGKKAEEEGA